MKTLGSFLIVIIIIMTMIVSGDQDVSKDIDFTKQVQPILTPIECSSGELDDHSNIKYWKEPTLNIKIDNVPDEYESKVYNQVGREVSKWSDEVNKKLLLTNKKADLTIDYKQFNPDSTGKLTKPVRKVIDSAYENKYNKKHKQ